MSNWNEWFGKLDGDVSSESVRWEGSSRPWPVKARPTSGGTGVGGAWGEKKEERRGENEKGGGEKEDK